MKRRAVVAAVLAGLLCEPSITRSCGPDLPEAVFVSYGEPDPPLADFADGRLGVLHPSFRQRYLLVAFRRLRGLPLDRGLALAAIGAEPREPGSSPSWAERWRTARNAAVGPPDAGMIFTQTTLQIGSDWVFFTSCLDDAFRTAIATLEDRSRRAGADRRSVIDWVRAQDQVFANCRGDTRAPAQAPADAPAWLVKDRAYQSAAALFYANRFDEARAAFEAIARDHDSPWSAIAPYMVARTLTRQGTLTAGWREVDAARLEQADAVLRGVLADPGARDFHAAALRLRDFLRFRLHRAERLAELSRAVAAPRVDADFPTRVQDLTTMLDHFSASQVESLAASDPGDEAADWVLCFQGGGSPGHALARWRARRDEAWLVAALSQARGGDPGADELLRAADALKPGSPGFATAEYHAARLLEERGRSDEARARLDRLLAGPARSWPRSAQNLLHARRLRLARDLTEFVAQAARIPAAMGTFTQGTWAPADSERVPRLDEDAAWLLNHRVPLEVLAELPRRSDLAEGPRRRIALAGWTRAVLLERHELGRALAESAAADDPALREGLLAYARAVDPRARDIAATWLLLHAPGLDPWVRPGVGRLAPPTERDVLHDNWWCRAAEDRSEWLSARQHARDSIEAELYREGWDRPASDAIVAPPLRGLAERERARLDSLGPAPDVLCRRALAWADRDPADPRLPEALALAVRSTRYGCSGKTTSAWSKRAFERLHRRYPSSEWTRRTPYWY